MSVLKIIRGIVPSATRTTLYGPEGVGKSTLAASAPRPLILDTERGSGRISCDRQRCPDWQTLTLVVAELAVNSQGYQTVVVDSIDWAEQALQRHIAKAGGKASVEDFGFGKGWVMVAEQMAKFLASCDALVDAGVNVILVAHSTVTRTSPPDQTDGYDRFELRVSKKTAPLIKEWSDALLFCQFKMRLTAGADGRMKGTGGKTRVIYSERCAAWDAKNRFGLPEEMPLAIESLEPLFSAGTAAPPATGLFAKAKSAIEAAEDDATLDDLAQRAKAHRTAGRLTDDELASLLKAIDDKGSLLAAEPAGAGA